MVSKENLNFSNRKLVFYEVHFFMFQRVIIIVVSDPPEPPPIDVANIGTTEVNVPFKTKKKLNNDKPVRSVCSLLSRLCQVALSL